MASAPPVRTPVVGDGVEVYRADFGDFPLKPGSARLVLADPPYHKGWTENYAALATFARDALSDGGIFAAYTGDAYALELAKVAERAGLAYYGYVYVLHRHAKQPLYHPPKTVPGKLVWVFAKGKAGLSGPYRGLASCGDGGLKDDHEWQQAVGEAEQLVEDFTAPGDLVVDPCAGSGTVAIAAARLGRRAVCIEKDEVTHRAAARKVEFQLRLDRNFGAGNVTAAEYEMAAYYAYEATILPPGKRTARYCPEGARMLEKLRRLWLAQLSGEAA